METMITCVKVRFIKLNITYLLLIGNYLFYDNKNVSTG